MTDEELIRRFQVLQAQHIAGVEAAVALAWSSLSAYDRANVSEWLTVVRPLMAASNTQMATLVDAFVANISSTQPLNVASRIDTLNVRDTGFDEVYRRPFIEHWQGLSAGREWEAAVRAGERKAVTLAVQDTQMVMREAMTEIVRIHAEEPDLVQRIPRVAVEIDAPELRATAPARPTGVDLPNPDLDVVAREQAALDALRDVTTAVDEPPAITETELPDRTIVGYRRVLTGRSCVFCATAATKVYKRGDLMPLHAHCDCGVAPVFLGDDPAFALNRQVLDNLKARGRAYWKQRGFVDNDGRPVDPTDLPASAGNVSVNPEIGPVFSRT